MWKSIVSWLKRRGHTWVYRNPHNRTCKFCNRNEVEHSWGHHLNHPVWWEIFNVGKKGHRCSEKDAE